jgi:hypothetical protein
VKEDVLVDDVGLWTAHQTCDDVTCSISVHDYSVNDHNGSHASPGSWNGNRPGYRAWARKCGLNRVSRIESSSITTLDPGEWRLYGRSISVTPRIC